MPRFRKKPVEVDAIACRDALHYAERAWHKLPTWLTQVYDRGGMVFTSAGVHLPTPEGTMLAAPDDWIICGVKGEVYPCKPDIFAATYDPVEG